MPCASSRSSAIARRSSASASSSRASVRVGAGRQLRAREAQRQRESDEPLLGAVVEVALEPLPLGVAGLDDARARSAQLLEPRPHLGLEALVLEREPGGRGHLVHELLVVEESGRVREHRHDPPVPHESRRCLAVASSTGRPCASTSRPVAERIGEDEVWIADDPGENVSEAAGRRRLGEVDDEPRDRRTGAATPNPAPRDAAGEGDESRRLPEPEPSLERAVREQAAVERDRERAATSPR